ncbi:hypothetical protein Tco_1529156 [Tanacetum coccineum]
MADIAMLMAEEYEKMMKTLNEDDLGDHHSNIRALATTDRVPACMLHEPSIPLMKAKRCDLCFIALAFFLSTGKVSSVSTCLLRCAKLVDAILLNASAFLFLLLGTCFIENARKVLVSVLTFSKYVRIT